MPLPGFRLPQELVSLQPSLDRIAQRLLGQENARHALAVGFIVGNLQLPEPLAMFHRYAPGDGFAVNLQEEEAQRSQLSGRTSVVAVAPMDMRVIQGSCAR